MPELQYARSLIEASLDPLVTISKEGKITDMNEALATITGITREQLTDSNFFEYFTEPQNAREVYQEIFAKGSVAHSPLTLRHKDGKLRDVLFNGSVYKDIHGVVLGAVVVARDTTEQKLVAELVEANKELAFQNNEKEKRAAELVIANKELAFQNNEKEKRAAELIIANHELHFQNNEKEKRAAELVIANKELAFQNDEKEKRAAELVIANKELAFQNDEKEKRAAELRIANYARSLIEASLDPLFTISPAGKITDTNNASVKITGIPREKLIGTDFFSYFTEPEKAQEIYQQVFAEGFVADYPLTIKDHSLTEVLFNGSLYKDEQGNVLGAVVVARNITEQKRVEKELNEAIVFAELTTDVAEIAKSKAEDAVKSKQQFLSNMSHEIRTPTNAIIGFTKVLLKTELTSKQKEYLNAIKISGDALIVLINDILDLAKVDSGKMTFETTPFRMVASISAMVHLFGIKIQEKNLILEQEYDSKIPAVLIGDSVRLHQIILNLLSNAVKFTSHGKITISVLLVSEDEEITTIEFAIKDTGIGIDDSKIETIFENFQQASSGTSRLYGGTGLGLAIAKQLVELQGGSISVVSKINEGSTFSFQLSFQKTHEKPIVETEPAELDTEIRHMKVLVVEDIEFNQLLLKALLDDYMFESDYAANGKVAIEKLEATKYDLILMDLQMPIMNGFETTEYIRNTMKSNVTIIALTADVTTVDLAKCKSVGMNDYIAKPIDEKLLYSKLVAHAKKSENERLTSPHTNNDKSKKIKIIDLTYLEHCTRSNSELMMKIIQAYMKRIPVLVDEMKQSFHKKSWLTLETAAHNMIPSFAMVGISSEYEIIARKIQDYSSGTTAQKDDILDLVLQIEVMCKQAFEELKEVVANLVNKKNQPIEVSI